MSSNEINELVVALKPEGVDETTDGLEDAQQSFEETADTVEDESGELEEFSQRFKGALMVATTALAIASGGLLAKVPIIREAFSGLDAILTEVGLAISQLLRDLGFEGVTNSLFGLADALGDADDETRDLIGALTLLGLGLAGVEIAAYGAATGIGVFKSTLVGGAITKAIAAIVGAIGALGLAIIGAVVLVALFLAAYATNFKGTRDVTNNVVNSWWDILRGGLNLMIDLVKTAFDTFIASWNFLEASLVNGGKRLGNSMVKTFTGWVNGARDTVVQGMNDILAKIEETVNKGVNALNTLEGVELPEISIARLQTPEDLAAPQPFEPRSQQSIRREYRGQMSMLGRQNQQNMQDFASLVGDELKEVLPDEIVNEISVDGRQITKEIEQFFGSSVANRGR